MKTPVLLRWKMLLISILTTGNILSALAQSPDSICRLDTPFTRLEIQSGLTILTGCRGRLTLSGVMRLSVQYLFRVAQSPVSVTGPGVCWLRLRVDAQTLAPMPVLLEIDHPFLEGLDVWLVTDEGRILTRWLGLSQRTPTVDRPYPHRNFVLPLTLPASVPVTVWLRLAKGPGNHPFPIQLWQPNAFRRHDLAQTAHWGGLIGWLLFAVVFSGFLFLIERDAVYALYGLYVIWYGRAKTDSVLA